MKDFRSLASSRRSIRKFTNQDIGVREILECIDTAVTAPSGCNSQCWEFVVIHKKEAIDELADIVTDAIKSEFSDLGLSGDPEYLGGKIKAITLFRNAPICIAVYMTELRYYDPAMESSYAKKGVSHDEFLERMSNPDILSIGALIQNLLLALQEKGFGSCWMNEPLVARREICDYLGSRPGAKLMSLIPVGYSAYTPKNKVFKPMADIVRVIE